MSENHSTSSAAFIRENHAKTKRSFNLTLIVAVVVLTAESAYLYLLQKRIDRELKAFDVTETVGTYRQQYKVNDVIEIAKKAKEWRKYKHYVDDAEDFLNKVSAEEYRLKELEYALDQINTGQDPDEMADILTRKIILEIESQENWLTMHAKRYAKDNLGELPDWTKKQIPKYGSELRHNVKQWITTLCVSTSDEFGETFDTFLEENADAIKEFSESTDDQAVLDKLDTELTEMIVQLLETTPIENLGDLQEQSDKFKKRLVAANEMLTPLVRLETEQLDPQQRRLRKAVALFMDKVHNSEGVEALTPKEKN